MPKNKRRVSKNEDEEDVPPTSEEEEDYVEEKAEMDHSEEEEEDYEGKGAYKSELQSVRSLLEKTVSALEKQSEVNKELRGKIARLEKDSPPEDVDEKESDVDHDPTEEEEDDDPSSEAASTPATSTTDVKDAFVNPDSMSKELEKLLDQKFKAYQTAIDQKIESVSTPAPFGFDGRLTKSGQGWLKQLIVKAITEDRKNCGGHYSTVEGRFGFKSGKGDDNSKMKTNDFIAKSLSEGWN